MRTAHVLVATTALLAAAHARATEAARATAAALAPAVTASGERVEVMLNVDHPDAVGDAR